MYIYIYKYIYAQDWASPTPSVFSWATCCPESGLIVSRWRFGVTVTTFALPSTGISPGSPPTVFSQLHVPPTVFSQFHRSRVSPDSILPVASLPGLPRRYSPSCIAPVSPPTVFSQFHVSTVGASAGRPGDLRVGGLIIQ